MKGAVFYGLTVAINNTILLLLMFLTISVYTSTGGDLSLKSVFTTYTLFTLLQDLSVKNFTFSITYSSEIKVALSRIQVCFLALL